MSDTVILSGEEQKTLNPAAALLLRNSRAVEDGLSRYEHEILRGLENDLCGFDELGFVGTMAAAALPAAIKAGALKNVFSFVGRVKDKAKKRAAARAKKRGRPIKEDSATISALTNIQSKLQQNAAKYSAAAESINNGIKPIEESSAAAAGPVVLNLPAQQQQQQQKSAGALLFVDESGKPTTLTISLLAALVVLLTKKKSAGGEK